MPGWWFLGSIAAAAAPEAAPPEATASAPEGRVVLPADFDPRRSLAPLVRAVSPAVVTIEVGSDDDPPVPIEVLELFGMHPDGMHTGEGSGFVITADGLVLTNHHVIAKADRITLVMHDGERVSARVLGGDADLDIALLQAAVAPGPFTFVPLGDSDALEVGDWVVAMGNGLGLGPTVTAGIVSGTGRRIGHDVFGPAALIQTDAAINQGNSGGPLFDLDGHVVGMATAIIPGANSVGFAIPSNLIGAILGDLRSHGRVARGYLGVQPQTLNEELRTALGVKARTGALVTSVGDDTPAARSGLRTGDVVVRVDGTDVVTKNDLVSIIADNPPGEDVTLTIERDTKLVEVKVTLAERPGTPTEASAPVEAPPTPGSSSGGASPSVRLGVSLAPLSSAEAADHGIRSGVRVERVEPGSMAAGRLQSGDVIVEIDRHLVQDPAMFDRFVARRQGAVRLLVLRGDSQQIVALPLP